MFGTLFRGSSRIRNAYICSSCLRLADAQLPRFLIDQTSRAADVSFSTTSVNWQVEGHGDEDQGPDRAKDGESNRDGKEGAEKKVSPISTPRGGRKGRRKPPPTLQISTSKETLASLRASMLAEEERPAFAIYARRAERRRQRRAEERKAQKSETNEAEKENVAQDCLKPSNKEAEEVGTDPADATAPTEEVKEKPPKSAKTKKSKTKKPASKPPEASTSTKQVGKIEKLKNGDVSDKNKDSLTIPRSDSSKSVKKAGLVKKTPPKLPSGNSAAKKKKSLITRVLSKKVDGEDKMDTPGFTIKDIGDGMDINTLKRLQRNLIRGIHLHTTTGVNMRKALIKITQDGRLSKEDTDPAVKLLRSALVRPGIVTTSTPGFQSLKSALQSNPVARKQSGVMPFRVSRILSTPMSRAKPLPRLGGPNGKTPTVSAKPRERPPPGPVRAVRGMTAPEIETIDSEDLKLTPLENGPLDVPCLSYGLERVLFNPGVYHLQDPRSRVFNFDPYLQTIMPVSEFDFNALKQYITSSRDNNLLSTAVAEKKKYTGSTSSMTSALGHFHFLLSQWRPINTETLSQKFPVEYNSFTTLQRGPVAIFLRWRDGTYAIDADKQFDNANILSMLGKSMEKLLTLPKEGFERYRKQNSDQISEEERNEDEAFHYTTMGDFLMRSQLDAHDPRLPGTGMFDLKTRAVISIRMDTSQYEEGSGYEIRGRHGEWESFEREYYDMIRAAFLKYSLQVRMGRMDGIFVAFHNTERIFGFQYISLSEMDLALHGTENTTTGDSEFKLSLELLNRVLDRATAKYPEKSLRIHFETRDAATPFMYIFAEPVEEEQIEKIQETNKAEIEEFETKVLGLSKGDVSEDQRQAEWDNLRAKVEESMEQDEMGEEAVEEDMIEDEHDDSEIWDENERRQVEELLSAAAQDDGTQDEDEDEDEDEVEETDDELEEEEDDEEDDGEDELVEDEELEQDIEEEEDSKDKNDEELEVDDQETKLEEHSEETVVGDPDDGLVKDSAESDAEEATEGEQIDESQMSETDESDGDRSELVEDEGEDLTPDKAFAETNDDSSESPEKDIEDNLHGIPPSPTHTVVDPVGPIFAMTLAIRNKVNGRYVDRPNNLTKNDKWTVEYALAEVPEEPRARALYEMAKDRRSKILNRAKDTAKDDAWNNQYIANIKNMSKRGREWRQEVDDKEKDKPKKVLDLRDGKQMVNKDRNVWEQKGDSRKDE